MAARGETTLSVLNEFNSSEIGHTPERLLKTLHERNLGDTHIRELERYIAAKKDSLGSTLICNGYKRGEQGTSAGRRAIHVFSNFTPQPEEPDLQQIVGTEIEIGQDYFERICRPIPLRLRPKEIEHEHFRKTRRGLVFNTEHFNEVCRLATLFANYFSWHFKEDEDTNFIPVVVPLHGVLLRGHLYRTEPESFNPTYTDCYCRPIGQEKSDKIAALPFEELLYGIEITDMVTIGQFLNGGCPYESAVYDRMCGLMNNKTFQDALNSNALLYFRGGIKRVERAHMILGTTTPKIYGDAIEMIKMAFEQLDDLVLSEEWYKLSRALEKLHRLAAPTEHRAHTPFSTSGENPSTLLAAG